MRDSAHKRKLFIVCRHIVKRPTSMAVLVLVLAFLLVSHGKSNKSNFTRSYVKASMLLCESNSVNISAIKTT